MDLLRAIELVVCAAQAGSFSKAARMQQLDPSTVSHAIAGLESHLGVKLFHRTTRQVVLTDDGEEVIRRGRAILAELAQINAIVPRADQPLRGTLRVGMSVSVSHHIVMPRLHVFMQRHPEVRLECLIFHHARDMHAAGLDIVFQSGKAFDSELVAREMVTLRMGVYGAPSYLEAHGVPQVPEDLLRHVCLVHKPSFINRGWDEWAFRRGDEHRLIKVPSALMTDDREGLLEVALAGGGLMRVGMFNPAFIASGRLRKVLCDWECPGAPVINVLYRKSARANPRTLAFLQFLDELFSSYDPDELTLIHPSRLRPTGEAARQRPIAASRVAQRLA